MANRIMSDAEIKRRKKVQGHISQTTSTLGLTGLGLLGAGAALKKKPGMLRKIPKYSGRTDNQVKAVGNKIGDQAKNIGVVSGGIGGVGGYNFAAYTNAESRKRTPVKKNDPFEISKFGNWKTIDQREQTQRRDRKVMRAAGAGAALGAGVTAAAYNSDSKSFKRLGSNLKTADRVNRTMGLKAGGRLKSAGKIVSGAAKAKKTVAAGVGGAALVGTAAAVGAGAKGQHTYQQHKINQRRRQNFKKSSNESAFGIVHD
jgi:hypothetical protein